MRKRREKVKLKQNQFKSKIVMMGIMSSFLLTGCGKSDGGATVSAASNQAQSEMNTSGNSDEAKDEAADDVLGDSSTDNLNAVKFSLSYEKIEVNQLKGPLKLKELIELHNGDEAKINDQLNTFQVIASRKSFLDSSVDVGCELSNKQFVKKKLAKGDTKVVLVIKSDLNEFDLKARCYVLDAANEVKVEKNKYSFPKRLFLNHKEYLGNLPFEIVKTANDEIRKYKISDLYLGPKAALITSGKNVEIEAENFIAHQDSKVMTFEEGARAFDNSHGEHGGLIRMNLKNAEGELAVELRGQDAGLQPHVAKNGYEAAEDPNKNAIGHVTENECHVTFVPRHPDVGRDPVCRVTTVREGRAAIPGQNGGNGEDGKDGFNGGNTGRLELIITNNNLNLIEALYPGKSSLGSKGGRGGRGQPGGRGAKGSGPKAKSFDAAPAGRDGASGRDGVQGKEGKKEFVCISKTLDENFQCIDQKLKEMR